MEIITRKRTVWLTFLDVLYKKELPLQSIHAKGVPFLCDPGAIQTHDLQNRNLTLYSLSYGALIQRQKYKKIGHIPNYSSFFVMRTTKQKNVILRIQKGYSQTNCSQIRINTMQI